MIRNTCRLKNTDNGLLVTIGEVVGGMAKISEGDKKVQTSNYKISWPQEWKYNIDNIANNTVTSV